MYPTLLIRSWFLVLYVLGAVEFIAMVVRMRPRRAELERAAGPLPAPGVFIPLGIPPILVLTGVGALEIPWMPARIIGLVLSIYFLIMLPLIMKSLGRFAVPGAGVYRDHELITTGPYAVVRHPLYSAVAVLWLATALGMVNWLLLALWPAMLAIMILVPMRQEDDLLRTKFGPEYERYARRTSRLIPGIW